MRKPRRIPRLAMPLLVLLGAGATVAAPTVADPDLIEVRSFKLPRYSDYLGAETRTGIARMAALYALAKARCDPTTKVEARDLRACEALYYQPIVAAVRARFAVEIAPQTIGGVSTHIVTPTAGVSEANAERVLIYVHGGGFRHGLGQAGHLGAMPVAAVGGYKVVAVNYRMAPEHRFPAASMDIAAVYRALLETYRPSQIGIYGCSAGGRLVGQALAWFAHEGLPRPAAVGILCSPPNRLGGDSNIVAAAIAGVPPRTRDLSSGYFKDVSPDDPLAFPGDFDVELKRYPATLLMTSTRDYSLSPMVVLHARLVRLGIPTSLHIFEGLGHAQYVDNPFIPETAEAAGIVADFFDARLDRRGASRQRRSGRP